MGDTVEVVETVALAEPPDPVWELVGDFARVAEWHPGVTGCRVEAGGTVRRVSIGNGLTVVHVLESRDDQARTYSYSVPDGAFPIQDMTVTFRVREVEGGCEVDLIASFVPRMAEAVRMARGFWRASLDSLGHRFGRLGA